MMASDFCHTDIDSCDSGGGSRVAGHQHGGLAGNDHDVLLRLADGLGDGFRERGEQRFSFILREDNRGFEFQQWHKSIKARIEVPTKE